MTRHLPTRHGRHQRGQATTEFVVLALALVPLMIALPLMGKYLDLMQATEASSRYVAFEAAARNTSNSWKTDAELAAEVRRRFFSNSDAAVKTNDVAGDFAANRNPLWVDQAGNALLDKFEDDVGAQGSAANMNAIPAAVVYRGEFKLSNDNLYTGAVTTKIANVPTFKPFDAINLSVSRKTILLADAWTADSMPTIRGKIEGATVAYPSGTIAPLIDAIGLLPTLVFDPALKVNDFEWDIVPCDRLVGGC